MKGRERFLCSTKTVWGFSHFKTPESRQTDMGSAAMGLKHPEQPSQERHIHLESFFGFPTSLCCGPTMCQVQIWCLPYRLVGETCKLSQVWNRVGSALPEGALMREARHSLKVRVGCLEEGAVRNKHIPHLKAREKRAYGGGKHRADHR